MHRGTRCLQKVEVCQLVEHWFYQKAKLQQCLGIVEQYVVGVQLLFFCAMFLKLATSNNASLQFFKFAGGCLLGFEDKFNRNDEFVLVWSFTKDKGAIVDEVLYFHVDGM